MKVVFQHEKLRQRRTEKHLTQEMLAERCDCSPRYLRDLESGTKCNPSGSLIRQITYVLDVPAEELFTIQSDDIMV